MAKKTQFNMLLTHHMVATSTFDNCVYWFSPDVILSESTPQFYELLMVLAGEFGIKLKEKYFPQAKGLDEAQKKRLGKVLELVYQGNGDIWMTHRYVHDHPDCKLVYVDTNRRVDLEKIYEETSASYGEIFEALADEPTLERFAQKLDKYMREVRAESAKGCRAMALRKSDPRFGDQMYAATRAGDPLILAYEQLIADNARAAYAANPGKKILFPIGIMHGLATTHQTSVYSKLEDIVDKRDLAI